MLMLAFLPIFADIWFSDAFVDGTFWPGMYALFALALALIRTAAILAAIDTGTKTSLALFISCTGAPAIDRPMAVSEIMRLRNRFAMAARHTASGGGGTAVAELAAVAWGERMRRAFIIAASLRNRLSPDATDSRFRMCEAGCEKGCERRDVIKKRRSRRFLQQSTPVLGPSTSDRARRRLSESKAPLF